MSAESSSLSLVLASSQTMRDVSGVGQSTRATDNTPPRSTDNAESRQSFHDHMKDVAKEASDAKQGHRNNGHDTLEREQRSRSENSPAASKTSAENRESQNDMHTESAPTDKKRSANKEPSAIREPSANRAPSANQEPSARQEPPANQEPLANKQPPVSKVPGTHDSAQAGNAQSAKDGMSSATIAFVSDDMSGVNQHNVSPEASVTGISSGNTPEAYLDVSGKGQYDGMSAEVLAERYAELVTNADGQLMPLHEVSFTSSNASGDFHFLQTGSTTLQALLVAEQTASGNGPLLQMTTMDGGSQPPFLSQVMPDKAGVKPDILSGLTAPAANHQVSEAANAQQGPLAVSMDLRMRVREAVLALVNRSGSSLPPVDKSLPVSGPGSVEGVALNAMQLTSVDPATNAMMGQEMVVTGTTVNQTGPASVPSQPLVNEPVSEKDVTATLLSPHYSDSETDGSSKEGETRLPRWQLSSQLNHSGLNQTTTSPSAEGTMVNLREGQLAMVSPMTMAAGETKGGNVSVQDLVEGLLSADVDSVETRSDRAVLSNGGNARPTGQTQTLMNTILPGVPGQSQSSAMAMASAQGALSLDQSMMQTRVGQQIMMMHEKGISSARIRLDPPELGSLLIKLEVQDRSAVVHFSAQNHMVRDSLEQQLPRLQELMDDMGLELSDASVESQSGGQEGTDYRDETGGTGQNGDTGEQDSLSSEQPLSGESTAANLSLVDQYV